jgi:hypothetical protein
MVLFTDGQQQLTQTLVQWMKENNSSLKQIVSESIYEEFVKGPYVNYTLKMPISQEAKNEILAAQLIAEGKKDHELFGENYRFPRKPWYQLDTKSNRDFLQRANSFVDELGTHPAVAKMYSRYIKGTEERYTLSQVFQIEDVCIADDSREPPTLDEGYPPPQRPDSSTLTPQMRAVSFQPEKKQKRDEWEVNNYLNSNIFVEGDPFSVINYQL